MSKTIAQQLNVKEFPFKIKDKNGNQIYVENSNGIWVKHEYDQNGKEIYVEITYIKDGERIIAKQLDETISGNVKWWTIEDSDGNVTTINSSLFHKITDPKLFSKKFKFFKVQNHIVD